MFKNLWLDNKKFLLVSGGGLLVFLVLNSFVSAYVAKADTTTRRARKLEQQVRQLHSELKNTYWSEQDKLVAYEEYEQKLAAALCQKPATQVTEGDDLNKLTFSFQKSIDSTWNSVRQPANKAGIALPEKLRVADFGISEEDGHEEFRLYWDYLDIVRNSLEALVAAEVQSFSTPEPLPRELLPVRDNESLACIYLPVSIQVTGSYQSFLDVLGALQDEGDFLQVRVRGLKPVKKGAKGGDDGLLRADVEFVGFRIAEAPAATGDDLRSRRGRGRKGTGRRGARR